MISGRGRQKCSVVRGIGRRVLFDDVFFSAVLSLTILVFEWWDDGSEGFWNETKALRMKRWVLYEVGLSSRRLMVWVNWCDMVVGGQVMLEVCCLLI